MQVRSFSGELALLLVELKYFFQSRIERFPILFVADGKQMMQIKSLRESALEEKKNLIERIGVLDETLAKANKNLDHVADEIELKSIEIGVKGQHRNCGV